MSQCPECGQPIKTVPAGVSKKTGKPYAAFDTCSNRECGWKPPKVNGFKKPEPNLEQQTQSDLLVRIEDTLQKMYALLAVAVELMGKDEEKPF